MNENNKIKENKETEAYYMATGLKEQNINIAMHLSKNKMLMCIARLIAVGFGFIIFVLGILGALWLSTVTLSGDLRWAVLAFTTLVAIYLFIFPIIIDKKREQYDHEYIEILKKNNQVLAKYENFLNSKKDI